MSTMHEAGSSRRKPDRDGWGITIVSDLHLSRRCHRQRHHGADHILHDEGFARFLGYLRKRAAERCSSWRLVVLGDLVDLPGGASPAEAVAELTRIAEVHPRLFEAVGESLAAGVWVDVVAGNHDIALLRPAVQERLSDLALATAGSGVRARITFHPWILHVPGVLYAEHGSQYHDINAVPALLGLDGTEDPWPAGRPLAAELERYQHDLRERRARVGRTAALFGAGHQSLRFAGAVARQALALSGPEAARRRQAYQTLTLRRYATEVGIPHHALVDIDQLSVASARSIGSRLARTWVVGPSARAARSMLPLRGQRRGPLWQPADRAADLRSAWTAIHRILRAVNQAVPFYVFGHTHHPEERPLADGTARYLNAGAWVWTGQSAPAPGTFVEITGEPGAIRPVAKLLRWNDETGGPEAVSRSKTSSAPAP
jgi:UDP-2,3-diacylglucosamine pyrophosphatase LpxH